MPTYSIITATYNRPTLLNRMIESVLSQTNKNWELIIIDDSTNNETRQFISKYSSHPQITYLKNVKNAGLEFSRNRGLEAACGEWVTFLDDDDFYCNTEALTSVAKLLENIETKWLVCNTVNSHGEKRTRVLHHKKQYNWTTDFLYGTSFRGDAVHFIRKEAISSIRYSEEEVGQWFFWHTLSLHTNFTYKDICVVEVTYLPTGLSTARPMKQERIYQEQQFREMIKSTSTWKYVPIIAKRYVASFVPVRKLINRLRNKQTTH